MSLNSKLCAISSVTSISWLWGRKFNFECQQSKRFLSILLLSIWFHISACPSPWDEIDVFEKNANNLLLYFLACKWWLFSNTCRATSFFQWLIFFLRSKRWLLYHSHFLIDFLSDNRKNSSIIYLFPLPSNLHQWLLIKNGNFSTMYSH